MFFHWLPQRTERRLRKEVAISTPTNCNSTGVRNSCGMLVSTMLRICKHFPLQEHKIASSEKSFLSSLSVRSPQSLTGGEHTRSRYQRAPIRNSCGILASTVFCICTHFRRTRIKWKFADQSPSGCCGMRLFERGAQEEDKASARLGYLPPISASAHGIGRHLSH